LPQIPPYRSANNGLRGRFSAHDPEKCEAVFRKDHAQQQAKAGWRFIADASAQWRKEKPLWRLTAAARPREIVADLRYSFAQ
jgi:hypothetical protein